MMSLWIFSTNYDGRAGEVGTMPTLIEGDFTTPPGRFALIAARFNGTIVDDLVAGAVDGLRRHGVADADIDLIRVPGSFEVPLIAQRLAKSQRYAAVVCLRGRYTR
jgi:6,7-dimethyl-8-ribityllumazine synthase